MLSLCLGLFLADAAVSFADDSLILAFNLHILTGVRVIVYLLALFMAIVIYGLIGLAPMIPKRLFLPVTLFNPVAYLLILPFFIYCYGRLQQVEWVASFCQVIFCLGILYWFQGRIKFRWPLLTESELEPRRFSWRNLLAFLLVNALVLLPAAVVYLGVCAALAVNHFSEGFMALHPGGLTVQVRKYVRNDGKTIHLCPMAHVGEPDFYRKLSRSFATNSIILLEGVTDNKNLLTNRLSYRRMATSLGLAEQETAFEPSRGELVAADVDVEQFTTQTIDFLNLAMLLHVRGVNLNTVRELAEYSPPPHLQEQLLDDLLTKRNRHLLGELHARLSESDDIVVPWGVAHMPEIAKDIQKSGFRLEQTQEYVVIRFRPAGHKSNTAAKERGSGTPK
ncbi:conserved membrane hypothetical protein [Verrucomicrobia bacterium]|nr:conserved membrane hypothetical protein [Verrucomicrobiota bacterium]